MESETRADAWYVFVGFWGLALKLETFGLFEVLPTKEVPEAIQDATGAWKMEVRVE